MQTVDSMDRAIIEWLQQRIRFDGQGNIDFDELEKVEGFAEIVAQDANNNDYPCPDCGARGAWEGVTPPGQLDGE
jgi:hypothetical protein